MSVREVQLFPEEVSLGLLLALAELTPRRREVWIDAYLVGRKVDRAILFTANRDLRRVFVAPEQLRVAI